MILRTGAAVVAKAKLDSGPAKEIKAESRRGLARLYGSYLTGFAQPKIIGNLSSISIRGKRTVPYKSMCAKGFKVSLPIKRAVGSPSLSAIHAWAASWIVIAKRKERINDGKDIAIIEFE